MAPVWAVDGTFVPDWRKGIMRERKKRRRGNKEDIERLRNLEAMSHSVSWPSRAHKERFEAQEYSADIPYNHIETDT